MLHRATLTLTNLEGRDVPSTSPVMIDALPLDNPSSSSPAAIQSDDGGLVALAAPEERITEARIDFAKLPAAGTGYTLKVTVYGVDPQANVTLTVDNTQGTNSPTDTRDAVKAALKNQFWEVEAVGDTKLTIKYWFRPNGFPGGQADTPLKKLDIEATGLKDNQKPTYSTTRVSVPPGVGFSGTTGGTWTLGFAGNGGAAVLQDDVLMTITLNGMSGMSTVEVSLLAGMTPELAAQEVANQLTAAGFGSYVSGSTVMYDDPAGDLDSIQVDYTALGGSPTVDWLNESIGFIPTP